MIVIFNFLTTNKFEWLINMPRIVAVGTVPLITIAVFLILFFYYRFYFFVDSYYNTAGPDLSDINIS